MKIFISWSGELSKSIAEIFRQWIPGVIQAAKPYYSPDDITKGARWNNEISKELQASKVGIICLTNENLNAPWIMFEAGALSKNLEKSKVVPMLFGVEPTGIQGPLIQFQAAKFSKSEMKKVIKMINAELVEGSLDSNVLDNVFEMWWPMLDNQIKEVLEKAKGVNKKDIRSDRDLLEEILSLSRESIIVGKAVEQRPINHVVTKDLYIAIEKMGKYVSMHEDKELYLIYKDLVEPVNYLMKDLSLNEPYFDGKWLFNENLDKRKYFGSKNKADKGSNL